MIEKHISKAVLLTAAIGSLSFTGIEDVSAAAPAVLPPTAGQLLEDANEKRQSAKDTEAKERASVAVSDARPALNLPD